MSNKFSLFWHDYETFGIDPRRDRAVQFAGVRTDEELNIIDEPMVIYNKPANDYLPQPEACMITGISPQYALEKGLPENEFIARILQQLATPGTCTVGYNNLRFDDEFTRYTLFRNFYDPYAREWQNGNSRWDIIDLLRLTRALRPAGINWPQHSDGRSSFKLEDLTKANHIPHAAAHDALSDVYATIAVARLIRQHQPRLYQYIYQLRSKYKVLDLLDVHKMSPVIHISGMYASKYGKMAIVVPLAMDPDNKNGIIVYDLRYDPESMLTLKAEDIQRLTFTSNAELEEGETRLPLKTIHINKCPAVVPLNTLTEEAQQTWQVDLLSCQNHLDKIKVDKTLSARIQKAFKHRFEQHIDDPDQSLYSGGFFSVADKKRMQTIHQRPINKLADLKLNFDDDRLNEMLFRYRCRNYPQTLLKHETERWDQYRFHRMMDPRGSASIKLNEYRNELLKLENTDLTEDKKKLLESLKAYPELIGVE
jgi:exodeoxyribonuclease-1